ncbi:hypothetical protein [Actinoplanes sp. NPDC049265]|uniref:hypothetical protein n=1 Tax=Actinoplanes sp. NPDC049265 TaxID=3363902 RepID=UPI0037144AF0
MDLKVMSELCADSRTVPVIPGMQLNVDLKTGLGGEQPPPVPVEGGRMPWITALMYPTSAAGKPLTTRFRDRLPPESLDKTAYRPPDAGTFDIAALGALADQVGHMVQVPKGDLAPPRDSELPNHRDRVAPLNAQGFVTTWDEATWIRVQPAVSPAVNAWSGVAPEVASMMQQLLADLPYSPGRIVPGADWTEVGLPTGMVDVSHADLAARFGRPLNNDDIATARAGGAGAPRIEPGLVEFARLMEQSPANSQAMVKVNDAADKPHVFLAHNDGFNVVVLDLGPGPAGARFPKDHGPVEVTMLPGQMPLPDRIDSLRLAGRPKAEELLRPLLLPTEVGPYRRKDGTKSPVLVVGRRTGPSPFIDGLDKIASEVGQPIVVLNGIGRDGLIPPGRVAGLRSVLHQEGVHGRVPVVVVPSGLKNGAPETVKLHALLDEIGASLVHPVPSGLGSAWTFREAEGNAASPGAAPGKRLFDQPDLPLLQLAAGENRRPKQTPPPTPVANFLTTPLTQIDTKTFQDLFSPEVKKLAPLVQQIGTRDPMLRGNSAAFQLAAMDQADTVTSFAGNPGNGHEALFKPIVNVPGETPAQRREGVQKLLPLLADLAGAYGMNDIASQGILSAMNAKITGSAGDQEIRDMIWDRKDHLPTDKRPDFVRLISDVRRQLPDSDGPSYDLMAEWILTCPPPSTPAPAGS